MVFSQTHKDFVLKVYGSGEMRAEMIEDYSSDKIIFLEPDSLWFEKEKNSSIFILSSDFEGMPNALMEAMATGIPCISTDCPIGGPAELISNKKNGLLVPTNNVEKMAEALCLLADNQELAYRISNSNSELKRKKSVESISKMWLDYIVEIIERRRKNVC